MDYVEPFSWWHSLLWCVQTSPYMVYSTKMRLWAPLPCRHTRQRITQTVWVCLHVSHHRNPLRRTHTQDQGKKGHWNDSGAVWLPVGLRSNVATVFIVCVCVFVIIRNSILYIIYIWIYSIDDWPSERQLHDGSNEAVIHFIAFLLAIDECDFLVKNFCVWFEARCESGEWNIAH